MNRFKSISKSQGFLILLLFSFFCAPTFSKKVVWPEEGWPSFWPKVTPESQGMSSKKLKEAPKKMITPIGNAIIIRNGYEVWRYGGEKVDMNYGWWASCNKQLISTLFGIAIKEGVIKGGRNALKQSVRDLGTPAAKKFDKEVTLEHLVGWVACGKPLGCVWNYSCKISTSQKILEELYGGKTIYEICKEKLLDPLGGNKWYGKYANDEKKAFFRLRAPASDAARWGYLWLNKGKWRNKQLFDHWFYDRAIKPFPCSKGGYANPDNGLMIWINENKSWHGLPKDSFAAVGALSATIWVCPSLNMVIARAGGERAKKSNGAIEEFIAPVLDALINP